MADCGCGPADWHFSAERAESDLRVYRRKGPTGTTRRLLRLLNQAGVRADSLLDIGGGVGVLQHELLATATMTATLVEGASAFLAAAREETDRRGQSGQVSFVHGDAVEVASALAPADLVTLDRVICCYPDMESLVAATAGKARRYWAASFPRQRWFVHLLMWLENTRRARAGNPFRSFVHPVARVHALLAEAGLTPVRSHRGIFWEIGVWARREGTS